MFVAMWMEVISSAVSFLAAAAYETPPDTQTSKSASDDTVIVVRPGHAEAERRRELREFARQILRPPRMRQPVARFFYPVCPQVLGLAIEDAEAIAERIRQNARTLGVGAISDSECTPSIKVAFLSSAAGPPQNWLSEGSSLLASLSARERALVLAETGPVRAWNRVEVRDFYGRPRVFGQITLIDPQPKSRNDPIVTTEITGAAVLIARDSAEGFTLAQLADYATMRTLVGTGALPSDRPVPARTILTLFQDIDPPAELTSFDRALVAELYNAAQNSSARRVYNDIAASAVQAEADPRSNDR